MKKYITLLLASAMFLSLFSCGDTGKNPENTNGSADNTSEEVGGG